MKNHSLGLDIGIASIGWAVVDIEKEEIIDQGVRCFEKAENAKTGESLNLPRRKARGIRRLIRRKKQRLFKIYALLKEKKILSEETISFLKHDRTSKYHHLKDNPWRLRSQALDEKLTEKELGMVLLHIAKHRGFRSMKKVASSDAKEDGKVLQAQKNLKAILDQGKARTLGELYWKNPNSLKEQSDVENEMTQDDLKEAQLLNLQRRNKEGHYHHTAIRPHIVDEIKAIFDTQCEKGHHHCTPENRDEFIKEFDFHTLIDEKQILSLVGDCTFEKKEKRSPLNSLTYEYFKWLQDVANLSFRIKGKSRSITREEQKKLMEFFKRNIKEKISYKEVRKVLDLEKDECFSYIKHSKKKEDDIEKNVFFTFKIMPSIRKGLKSLELENKEIDDKCSSLLEDWRKNLANDNPAKIDLMVESACYFPEESSILEHFKTESKNENIEINETDEQLTLYLDGKVAKVGHLSFKAMKKIIQAWESADEVLVYDKACDKAGYDHTTSSSTLKHFFPDRPESEEVINPVVYRAICQLQKVLKNVFQKHGHLKECVIEVARELAHSHKQRGEIKKGQDAYKTNKDKYVKEFKELFNREPRGDELTKYRLWKEQTENCPYRMQKIGTGTFKRDIEGENLLQIDHIIPYSRCFDNTMNNKVLVYTDENLQKKNQTPYEYFGGASDSTRWQDFNTFINSLNLRQAKKNKLLLTEIDEGEFRKRNLVDTQYISRLATEYLKEFKNSEGETIPIVCRKGGITADLRHRWGLNKDRSEGDKHHAMDAIVLAVSTNAQMQRITRLHQRLENDGNYKDLCKSKIKEAKEKKDKMKEYREKELFREEYKKYFLEPWIGFRKDVLNALEGLFVSHRVSRKVTGQAHEESIYAWDDKEKLAKVKTSLANITKKMWEDLLPTLPEDARNKIGNRLKKYNFNIQDLEGVGKDIPKKQLKDIFQEPIVYKNKHGQSEKISSFKVPRPDQKTGLHIHGATAKEKKKNIVANASSVRLDIFKTRKGQFIASQLYVSDVVKKILPIKIKDKKTEEWREMEKEEQESLTFCFSLQKNDLIEYVRKDNKNQKEYVYRGYYNGFDISTQSIIANAPDRRHFLRKAYGENEGTWEEVKLGGNENKKKGEMKSIGIKTMPHFKKLHVDVLGKIYAAKAEKIKPLRKKQKVIYQGG